jgi:hypothetical protein
MLLLPSATTYRKTKFLIITRVTSYGTLFVARVFYPHSFLCLLSVFRSFFTLHTRTVTRPGTYSAPRSLSCPSGGSPDARAVPESALLRNSVSDFKMSTVYLRNDLVSDTCSLDLFDSIEPKITFLSSGLHLAGHPV